MTTAPPPPVPHTTSTAWHGPGFPAGFPQSQLMVSASPGFKIQIQVRGTESSQLGFSDKSKNLKAAPLTVVKPAVYDLEANITPKTLAKMPKQTTSISTKMTELNA